MTPALLSAAILIISLILFVSDRIRHDLVAVIALLLCVLAGIVAPTEALSGFSDPAVITVAAVLIVGRAIELSGVASALATRLSRMEAPYEVQFFLILAIGALLSAFMNNIAALVITMPVVSKLAQDAKRSPTAALMPLAFATILGGMTTLIGTPPNLILSSIRREHLGEGFGFFEMSGLGITVTAAGLIAMALIADRLLPERRAAIRAATNPWRVFELILPKGAQDAARVRATLRDQGARMLGIAPPGVRRWTGGDMKSEGRRVLVLSRKNPWNLADDTNYAPVHSRNDAPDAVTVRCVVAHGSFLIGRNYDVVAARTEGQLAIVAAGPRAARARKAMQEMQIQAGDQLFIHGSALAIAEFVSNARLLEIGRHDAQAIDKQRAASILGIFGLAIAAAALFGVPPSIAFVAAAAAIPAFGLMPVREVYQAIDWPVIVLLAAMIPVGMSFETTGAAEGLAQWLNGALSTAPAWLALAALGAITLLLSAILNNVATAIIMGPLAIQVAQIRDFSTDAALLMIVVGASAAFLTPIGHQNNLLVMRPGGYLFSDFARLGGPLAVVVLAVATAYLSIFYL
ncbi:citrate transporter [Pacificimonas flava]|uniref:Citrate transporter n=2 Tax=Pacificimonas TaxID=1960290 RepID=A0A219B8H3_9SPHN|nr:MULTISPECIES: SLC13 family permease [Pacificimonas]MBZ6379953.1 SLC13/DASS family transporter [Pacificimonas aurantium]OWV34474.1 citrate transporter [Pacificimonas flava]